MEEIIGSFLRGFVQGIGYVIGELLCKYVFQYTGAFVLKVLTLGQKPKSLDIEPFETVSGSMITILGFVVWLSVFLYWALN